MKKILLGVIATALVLAWSGAAVQAAAPYTSDGNTILLDHYDGSTVAAHVGGTVSYVNGPSGLSQAADLSNGGWLKYGIPTWNDSSGTLEAWVYPRSFPITVLTLQWNNSNTPPPAGYVGGFGVDGNGVVQVSVWNAGDMHASAAIPTNTWTHIAITWSPSGSAIYLNGVQAGSSAANLSPALWSNPTYLYVGNWGNGDDFVIDELRVSDSARDNFPTQPPVAMTLAATGVTSTAATLQGTVNASGLATGARFQYGSDTNYGSVTAIQAVDSVFTNVTVTAALGGLSPYGVYHFQLMATNAAGTNYGADMVFTNLGTAPTILTSSPLPDGVIGVLYSQTLTATGGLANYTWSLASGNLPAGLNLSAAGVISGRPTAVGPNNFAVVVAGSDGLASTNDFSLAINLVPATPVTNVIDGVTVDYPGTYVIGPTGAFYALIVTNSGVLNATGGQVGSTGIANASYAAITGAGSLWNNSGSLFVGAAGAGYQLAVANGAQVRNTSGYVGYEASASNNTVQVTGPGSVWSNSAELAVGYQGSSNSLVIGDGGQVLSTWGVIGWIPGSSNNTVLVTGPGSVWSNSSSQVCVGSFGSGNSLTIANGGRVFNTLGQIGSWAGANNNAVLVTGSGSAWNNNGDLYVGNAGSGNSLAITNGGKVFDISGVIGYDTGASNNTVLVTGSGSLWSNNINLHIGYFGSGNSLILDDRGRVFGSDVYVGNAGANNNLTLTNGGQVFNSVGRIGNGGGATNNTVLVTGTGSVWSNSSDMSVGLSGSGNRLTLAAGGQLFNNLGVIGYYGDASSNEVLVTGAGSAWNNNGDLYVGNAGSGNSLTIANDGAVAAGTVVIGVQPSSGNAITVSGGNLHAAGTGGIDVRYGTLTLNSGSVIADSSLTVSGNGIVALNGGSLTAPVVSNAGQFGMSGGALNVAGVFNNAASGIFNLSGGTALVPLLMNNAGTFNQSGGFFDPATFTNSGTLVISGGTNEATLFLNLASGIVQQSGGEQDVNVATNFGAWTITGGVANLTNYANESTLTVSGGNMASLQLANNGLFDLSGGALGVTGAFTNSGVFTHSAGNAVVSGAMDNRGVWTQAGGTLGAAAVANSGAFMLDAGGNSASSFVNSGAVQQNGGRQDVGVAANSGGWTVAGGLANLTNFSNEGGFTLSGGTNTSALFVNQAAGGVFQSGGEQNATVASNLGGWMVTGGVANMGRFVNDSTGALTINDGAVTLGGLQVVNGGVVGLNGGSIEAQTVLNGGGFGMAGGTLGVAGAFTNAAGATFDLSGGQAVVTARMDNRGAFTQSGGGFGTALLDNSGTLTLNGGTNSAALLVNQLAGVIQQGGGEQNANIATNFGAWTISGGVANVTNFISEDHGILAVSGGFLNGSLTIGNTGSFNEAMISSGGRVLGLASATIGSAASSSNNLVTVTDVGSVWSNAAHLRVGNSGSGNNLVISNGGQVVNGDGYIGYHSGATDNRVLVTGAGSVWNNANELYVGWSGSGNSLVVTNGGRVVTAGGRVGMGFSSGNAVLVSGANSLWANAGAVYIGQSSANNSLIINDGALVTNGSGWIGYNAGASGNTVTVSGPGTVWSNYYHLGVGYYGSGNSLIVSNGSQVINRYGEAYIGRYASASNNSVVVTGAGALLQNANNRALYVGNAGSGNSLTVSDGGVVRNGDGYVGFDVGALNNAVQVGGAGSVWTNAGILTIGGGGAGNRVTLTDGGAIYASVLSNRVGSFFGMSGGNAFLPLINNAGTFTQSGGGSYSGESINSGTLAISGGTNVAGVFLNLLTGIVQQSGGEQDANVATNFGAWTITGGTLNADGLINDGSGVFTVSNGVVNAIQWVQGNGSGTMTLNGGSMTTPVLMNDGQFNMGGGTLDVAERFWNQANGTFNMSGGDGSAVQLTDNQGAFIQSGGVFYQPLLNNAGTLTLSNGTNTATLFLNLATGVVGQSGGVHNVSVATNLGAWTVSGGVANLTNFINDGTGALTVSGGSLYATNAAHSGVLDVRSGTFTMNSGIVVADNLYSLDPANSIVVINGGSVTVPMVLNGGQFGMNGGTLTVAGGVTNLATGRLNVTGGEATVSTELNNLGLFTQSGGVLVTPLFANNATMEISGGTNTADLFLNLPGASVWQSGGRQDATTVTNLGSWLVTGGTGNLATFINDNGAALIVSNGTVNAGTALDNRNGTFTLDGGTVTAGQFYLTNGALSAMNFNGGTLNSGGSVVSNGSLFTVGNGTDAATLRLLGGTHIFANDLFINTNGTLTGVGTINPALGIWNAGTIAPGSPLGTLVDNGDLTMMGGSTMAMQLGGTNTWEFDQFIVNGTFNITGTLDISLLGYMPMAGDVFDIFDFGYDVGRFSQTNLPGLLPMLYWDTHALYTLGEIEVDPIEGLGPGRMHTTVLRGDGTVWGWGFNELGQVGDGTTVSPRLAPRQVVGLSEIRSVSCKDHYAVALKSDGTVWTWGSNNNGQLGDGTITNRSSPVMVTGLDDVMTAVAAGYYHSLALKWDGTVWTWGNNFNGQLGDGYVYEYSTTPVQAVGLTNVLALAAGQYHSVALDMVGTVWTWGNNENGALGLGPMTNRMVATQVPGLTDVKAIAAGVHTTFALKQDGTVWAWGLNNKGQLGNGSTTNCLTPVQVSGLTGVRAIAAGHYHAVALKSDRTVWTWGWNHKGQLGDGTDTDRSTPVQVVGFSNGAAVAAGEVHTMAAKSDGTIVSWGGGAYGQLGNGVPEYSLPPVAMNNLNILGAPLVTTLAATAVGSSTATLNGSVIPDGWPTTAYFRWGTTTSYGNTTAPQALGSATTNVAVSASLAGLTPYGVYHFQMVATNIGGTVYGADRVFTNNGVVPIIATLSPLPGAFIGSAYSLALSSSSGLAPHTWSVVSGGLPAGVTLAANGAISGAPTAAGAANFRVRVTGADGYYAERDFNLTVFSFGYGVALPSAVIDASYNRTLTVSGGTGPYTWAVTSGALPTGLALDSGGVLSGTPTVAGTYNFTIQVTDTSTGVTASLPVSLTVGSGVVPPIVGAGRYHTVAMKGDGSLWSWGNNDNGQLGDGTSTQRLLPVQATSLSGLNTVSAKDLYTVALKNDGTVWACGWNAMGQLGDGSTTTRLTPVQVSGLSGVTAISAGYYHTLAVRSGGSVWAWGHNSDGQLGDGTTTRRTTPVQVSGLSGAAAVAAGQYHSLAAKADGTVWSWGYNGNGQLGDGSTTRRMTPVQVSGLAGVAAVAAGVSHSLVLKGDGTVWAWGYNSNGQLGDGTATQRTTPVQVSGLTDVIAIAAGDTHSVALKSDGTVWAWGLNSKGQIGDGTTTERRTPVQVAGFSGGATIAGGSGHTVAAKSDGSVWAWGSDVYGQLGNGTTALWSTPVQVGGLNFLGAPVVATLAATGVTSTAATLNGTVNAGGRATTALFQWGATTNYGSATVSQAVGSASTNVAVTASLSGLSAYSVFHYRLVATNSAGLSYGADRVFTNTGVAPVIATASALPAGTAGSAYSQALSASGGGTPYNWSVVSNSLPAGLTLASGGTISGTPTATGTTFRVRVTGSDALYAERTFSLPVISFTLGSWLPGGTISGAYSQTLLATGGTGSYSWLVTGGSLPPGVTLDAGGLLSGTPTTAGTYSFTLQVTDANGAQASQTVSLTIGEGVPIPAVGAGRLHTVALKADGTVWVIGNNDNGQLGDGTVTGQLIPEQLVALSGVSTVSAKDLYSMALKQDGTVWAWGYNTSGQLGDGTTTTRLSPVQVSGLNGVTAIAAGYYHSMALRADGTVWTWGNNGSGQLGDGTITRRLTPIQVPGLSGVRAVAAGQYHSVALKADGTVWTWGWNANGRLGDGTTTDRRTPVQVSGLSGVIAVGAGLDHCLALKADGTVWAWGLNTKGQLGDGTTTQRLTPVQVSGLAGVTAVASGDAHCAAVKGDGTVWCWGANAYGQLGDGTTTQRLTPVQVVGFSGMAPVVAGASHTIVLGADHTLWGWGSNRYGQLGVGPGITGIWPLPVQVDPVDLLGDSWAVTLPATGVAGNAATLNGSINPNGLETSVYFRWGTSTSYGNVTASAGVGAGTDDVVVSAAMTGLMPGAAYHYQLVATNSAGLAYGADMVFTNSLPSAAPTAVQLLAAGDTGASSSDGLTNLDNGTANKTLAFRVSGTVAGATVSLYDGGTAIGSATAAGATTDVFTSGTAALAAGAHSIVARQTQPGMAQSAASPAATVTVDTTRPAITAAVSRKTHGSAGTFDLALALGSTVSVEPRKDGPTMIVFTFSKNIAAADGQISANEFSIGNALYSNAVINGNTLTLSLAAMADGSVVTVALSGITDLAGNAIGGVSNISVRALYGDVNRNGSVTIGDQQSVKNALGMAVTAVNFLNDLNVSGGITIGDQQSVKNALGHMLASPATPPGAGGGSQQQAGTLAFSAAGYSAMATAGSVPVTVTRVGGGNAPATVAYATSDGTAVAGINYLSAAGTLSFAAGETSKTFSITVLNGLLWTGEGTVNLSLSSPGDGATLGAQSSAVLTITDEDLTAPGLLRFSTAASTAIAEGTRAVVTVTRTGGCAGAVSVTMATTGGTATPWTDYSPVLETLHFADGETSKTFTVPLLGNAAAAGETIELDLLNPAGGASLVAPSRLTITLD